MHKLTCILLIGLLIISCGKKEDAMPGETPKPAEQKTVTLTVDG
jgi:hypothetical protein